MQDKSLLAIALALGIIGLIVLYFISEAALPEIETRPLEAADSVVRLRGIVTGVEQRGGIQVIRLEYEAEVVFFEPVPAFEGMEAEIIGEVSEYNGRKEVLGIEIN